MRSIKIPTLVIIISMGLTVPAWAGGSSWSIKIVSLRRYSPRSGTMVVKVLGDPVQDRYGNPFYLRRKCSTILVKIEYDPITSQQTMWSKTEHELALASLQQASENRGTLKFGTVADGLPLEKSHKIGKNEVESSVPKTCRVKARTIRITSEGRKNRIVYAY